MTSSIKFCPACNRWLAPVSEKNTELFHDDAAGNVPCPLGPFYTTLNEWSASHRLLAHAVEMLTEENASE